MTIDASDANVKTMRETARQIGLTALLASILQTNNAGLVKQRVREALRLLGEEPTS